MRRFVPIGLIVLLGLVWLGGCAKKPTYEELFEQARLHQENQEYDKAIDVYQKIVKLNPQGERSDEAQFMVGFIYANDLNDQENARAAYETFLDRYSATADSGMILSAEWELEHIGRDITEIDELKSINAEESGGGEATGVQAEEK